MADILLGPRESTILAFQFNDNSERVYHISTTSYFINSSSNTDGINVQNILHYIPPYNSEEMVYIPFAYNTANISNEVHLLVSFFVRNNAAAETLSRLEIWFHLEATATRPPHDYVFNVTFGKEPGTPLPATDDSSPAPPQNCVASIQDLTDVVENACETCSVDRSSTIIGVLVTVMLLLHAVSMIPIIFVCCKLKFLNKTGVV